jgi:hypothetical protein
MPGDDERQSNLVRIRHMLDALTAMKNPSLLHPMAVATPAGAGVLGRRRRRLG